MRRSAILIALLGMLLSLTAPGAMASQTSEAGSASKTVNVQFIVDVSGSMAEPLATGEIRIDAAKRVLNDVFASIPNRKGINVGLRIYGYEGDNSDATKDVSCKSSKLAVPMKGVNREALSEQVNALQPTGWTPIALSLQRAEKDFPAASKNVTNAIVLITDGVETCDGDPCSVASSLQSGSKHIATNVVGLALTDDQQQTISCIAEQGNGQQFGAGSGEELSSSLFSVLEKLDIVVDRGSIGGNAFSLIPAGDSGKLSVVAHGVPSQMSVGMPVVIRNNTTKAIKGIDLSATARDSNGALLGAGNAIFSAPFVIVPGGLAIAAINFGGVEIPEDATFDFKIQPMQSSLARFRPEKDLDVVEANVFEDRIVGTLKNSQSGSVGGPIQVGAVCFDLEGNALSFDLGNVQAGTLAKGETASVQVTLLGYMVTGQGCPAFLIAGYGLGTP